MDKSGTLTLPYADFQQPPSPLFRDYLASQDSALRFYAGDWNLAALAAAAPRILERVRPRAALAEALVRQQEAHSAPEAAANAARLADPGSLAVVTGQQSVLFGGPLYVLYKALAAVKVAAQLEQLTGRPVVPVFWVAADDHDFAEIRQASVLDAAGQIRTLRYTPHREPHGQPASQIVLDETIEALLQELADCLPPGLHRESTLARLRACYRPAVAVSEAFARWISSILPGLVVLDPTDPALKPLMAPVMEQELREASPTSTVAAQVGEELLAAGYHQQVPVRAGFLNLFVVMGGERRALALQEGGVEVRGLGRRLSLAGALELMHSEPTAWSPGALLRPLAQDAMLPTVAYVGGPAEIAYHAQIGPAYARFGIPRPLLLPRPSVTMVEPVHARALEAEGLTLPDLQDPEAQVTRWARETYPEVEAAFARARQTIEGELAGVEEALGRLDATLRGAAESARGRALHPLENLHEKAMRALKKRDQARIDRLRRTRDALLPGGAFQERGLSLLGPLARHGDGLVAEIALRMDPWARGHQVLNL